MGPHGSMQGLQLQHVGPSFLTGIQPGPPALGSAESQPLDHQRGARNRTFLLWLTAWNWEIPFLHYPEMPGGKSARKQRMVPWGGWVQAWQVGRLVSESQPWFPYEGLVSPRSAVLNVCTADRCLCSVGHWWTEGRDGKFKMKRIQLILDPESKSICFSLR